jgi:hypothetical protein
MPARSEPMFDQRHRLSAVALADRTHLLRRLCRFGSRTSLARSLVRASWLVALVGACGGNAANENPAKESGDAGSQDSGAGSGMCRRDSDCTGPYVHCGPKGFCAQCLTDADCNGGFCNALFLVCEGCRTDQDCPAMRPACVRDWEYQTAFCATCRAGSSEYCPSGQWCQCNAFLCYPGGVNAGQCIEHHCATDPLGADCLACHDENSDLCTSAGGACEAALGSLSQCYAASAPGGTCNL